MSYNSALAAVGRPALHVPAASSSTSVLAAQACCVLPRGIVYVLCSGTTCSPRTCCCRQCGGGGGADEQFRYVLTLLLVSALLQLYAEIGPLPYRWHAWRTLSYLRFAPRMIGMCIGWAAGTPPRPPS